MSFAIQSTTPLVSIVIAQDVEESELLADRINLGVFR